MLRALVGKVESTQEQMGSVSREMEILRKNQIPGDSGNALCLFQISDDNLHCKFLEPFFQDAKSRELHQHTYSISILWSQEGSPMFKSMVDQKTHISILQSQV